MNMLIVGLSLLGTPMQFPMPLIPSYDHVGIHCYINSLVKLALTMCFNSQIFVCCSSTTEATKCKCVTRNWV